MYNNIQFRTSLLLQTRKEVKACFTECEYFDLIKINTVKPPLSDTYWEPTGNVRFDMLSDKAGHHSTCV